MRGEKKVTERRLISFGQCRGEEEEKKTTLVFILVQRVWHETAKQKTTNFLSK